MGKWSEANYENELITRIKSIFDDINEKRLKDGERCISFEEFVEKFDPRNKQMRTSLEHLIVVVLKTSFHSAPSSSSSSSFSASSIPSSIPRAGIQYVSIPEGYMVQDLPALGLQGQIIRQPMLVLSDPQTSIPQPIPVTHHQPQMTIIGGPGGPNNIIATGNGVVIPQNQNNSMGVNPYHLRQRDYFPEHYTPIRMNSIGGSSSNNSGNNNSGGGGSSAPISGSIAIAPAPTIPTIAPPSSNSPNPNINNSPSSLSPHQTNLRSSSFPMSPLTLHNSSNNSNNNSNNSSSSSGNNNSSSTNIPQTTSVSSSASLPSTSTSSSTASSSTTTTTTTTTNVILSPSSNRSNRASHFVTMLSTNLGGLPSPSQPSSSDESST